MDASDAKSRDFNDVTRFNWFNSTDHQRGPSLAVVAVVYTVLSLVSSVIAFTVSRGTLPPPYGLALQPRFFWAGYLGTLRIAAFLQFVAAIPLGVFAASAVSRLRFLGFNVAGVFIALFGGFTAALFMALSGLFQWTLSEPAVATLPATSIFIHFLSFAMGSVGFAVAFGVFVLPFTVMSRFTALLPPWMVLLGAVIVILAVAAGFTLLFNVLAFLPPIVHFLGFVWIIATGFLMPRTRPAAQEMKYPAAA